MKVLRTGISRAITLMFIHFYSGFIWFPMVFRSIYFGPELSALRSANVRGFWASVCRGPSVPSIGPPRDAPARGRRSTPARRLKRVTFNQEHKGDPQKAGDIAGGLFI